MIYKLYLIVVFPLLSQTLFGLENLNDYLIYKGDTFKIIDWPLEDFYKNKIKPDVLYTDTSLKKHGIKNYSAFWKLENDSLFLSKLIVGKTVVDFSTCFGNQKEKNKVFAYWFNKSIFIFFGKPIIEEFYRFKYEKEFCFENGLVSKITDFSNSQSFRSKYSKNPDLLRRYIRKNINYNIISDLNENVEILISIEKISDMGKIDSVRIYKGYNDLLNNEAIRIVKSIPKWDILYAHGKRSDIHYLIPVLFEKKGNNNNTRLH